MKAKKERKSIMEKGKKILEEKIENYVNEKLLPIAYEITYQCIMEAQLPSKKEFNEMILERLRGTEGENKK